jgi:hypothetical protein
MKQETYSMKQIVLKRGIHNDRIMMIWEGSIEVIVNRNNPVTGEYKSIWFENINRGTCFNVFCAFSDRMTQMVDFKALSKTCVINSIKVGDLRNLAKKHSIL